MKLEDYNAEAVCRAMNLPAFIEEAWTCTDSPTIRIVLMPSFNPEVCITLSRQDQKTALSVRALAEHFWIRFSTRSYSLSRQLDYQIGYQIKIPDEPMSCWNEEASAAGSLFDQLSELFDNSMTEKHTGVCIDGMPIETCLVSRNSIRQFKDNPFGATASKTLAATVLDAAWNACEDLRIKNALANCGTYVGRNYPRQELPPEKPTTKLVVLGTPEGTAEYFEKLTSAKPNRV